MRVGQGRIAAPPRPGCSAGPVRGDPELENDSHIELETVRQEGRELASLPGSAAESGPRYDDLVADVRTMITRAEPNSISPAMATV